MPPSSRADGPHTPIDAGERLAKSQKDATSSARTTRRWRRRGRRIGAAALRALHPHARRSLPPASSRTPRVRSLGAACRGRVLRRTPTHPRHDLRVALRAISHCHRTAEGPARTYRISAHSAGRRNASRTYGHVARDALRVWLRGRSTVSREWWFRPNHSCRRRPRCVRSVRSPAPVLESTIRPLRPKHSSHACVHSAHSAQIRF